MVAPFVHVSAVVIFALTSTAVGSVINADTDVVHVISFAFLIKTVWLPAPKTAFVVTGELVDKIQFVPPSSEYSNPATESKFAT